MKKVYRLLLLFILSSCTQYRFSLIEENDYFKPDANRDSNYSQGLIFSGTKIDERGQESIFLQHAIYTPDNLRLAIPERSDRGYAGFLAVGYESRVFY